MTDQLTRLAKPIPEKWIKRAPGGHGDYCDHEIINQILLKIVGPFSFDIQQVLTRADGVIEGCTATLTVRIDEHIVTITEAGDCDQPDPPNSKTQGDRLKKAASDALKRCAMRLSLGLHLWAGNERDYFLYAQLVEVAAGPASHPGLDAGTKASAEPSRESVPADVPAATPFEVGEATLTALQARVSALLADHAPVADSRIARGLPPLKHPLTAEQADGWADLLTDLETNVTVGKIVPA